MSAKLILPVILLCGCSHITKIGTVGNREFYKVQATSLLGPSMVTLVSMPIGDTNRVELEQSFAGNGLAPAVVGSAGIVAGSVLWGHSYKGEQITVVASPEKIAEPEPIEPPKPPPTVPPGLRPPDTVPHKKPHYSRVPELWHKATGH